MTPEAWLDVAIRFLHVISAIALLGGTVFFLVVMLPAVKVLDDDLRTRILLLARKRFYRVTHPALLLLILSGVLQFVKNLDAYRGASSAIHALLGVKILLALIITGIVFAQSFGVLPGCPARWAKANLCMGILIVALAAAVRGLRLAAL